MPINLNENEKFIEEDWFGESSEGLVLLGTMCKSCNKTFFPKKYVCPDCFGDELEPIPLSKKGTLHSYTFTDVGLPEFGKPYAFGFIDLPEKIRLYSLLTDCEPWEKPLKLDSEMEMVFGKIKKDKDGHEIISYKFRPVERS